MVACAVILQYASSPLPGEEVFQGIPRVTGEIFPAAAGNAPAIMKSTHVYVKNSTDPVSQSLDLYVPAQTVPGSGRPILVYVHGGGLARGSKNNLKGHEVTFPRAGFITACINYRKSDPGASGEEKTMYPDHVEDVAAAIAWLHYNARSIGGDPNRIYLLGHSSGASLVALVATDERFLARYQISLAPLKGVICNDGGFFDLMERAKRPQSRRVIENAYGPDPEVWKMASPSTHVRAGKNIPPFFLTYTTGPKEAMSESFARRLTGAGIPVTVFPSLGRDHEEVNGAVSRPGDPLHAAVFQFLDRQGSSAAGNPTAAQPAPAPRVEEPPRKRKRPLAALRNALKDRFGRI
jgi:acetyl esterase/lipase